MYKIHRDCKTKTERREGGKGGEFRTQEINRDINIKRDEKRTISKEIYT